MAAVLGCTGLTSGDSDPVAIELDAPPSTIAVNETITIVTRALNRSGGVIPGVIPVLIPLNPDTLGVTDDGSALIGRLAGAGRYVAAISGTNLQTSTFPISVTTP